MRGEESRSLLITGNSQGELLLAVLLVGLLMAEAVREVPGLLQRVSQAEAFGLSMQSKVHWIETWAHHGVGSPAAGATPFVPKNGGQYMEFLQSAPGDVTANFILASRFGPEGALLTFRPAFAEDSAFSVLWVCGRAPVPRGFKALGENHTTLAPGQLLSACREPAT